MRGSHVKGSLGTGGQGRRSSDYNYDIEITLLFLFVHMQYLHHYKFSNITLYYSTPFIHLAKTTGLKVLYAN